MKRLICLFRGHLWDKVQMTVGPPYHHVPGLQGLMPTVVNRYACRWCKKERSK